MTAPSKRDVARQLAPLLARALDRVDLDLVDAADTPAAPPADVVSAVSTAPGTAVTRPPDGPGATPSP